jgi:hypothetical protein
MDLFTLAAVAFVLYAISQGVQADQSISLTVGPDGTPPQPSGATDMSPYSNEYTPSVGAKLLAGAIAVAEGFGLPGARPTRDHNPGDMTSDLIGKAVGKDGAFVVYANDDDGWMNLYYQCDLWLSGQSAHAGPDSTIQQIADFYTATQQSIWANNVANHLGVSVDTPIGSLG